ncbi:Protein SGT1 [Purpureocillium lavendulum]|uniref:Protein SGT1 n=1 Tax=Purpureocillium lavendulum TaxID=1247861 RepID=A0AB34FP88_9HYPO|nr:Protein SGT1 [Purpureocillium lavendulum]
METPPARAAATLPASPYASRIINLVFDESVFRIHEQFLAKEPWLLKKLAEQDQASRSRKHPEVNLKHISHHVGHVLVHYLVTGTYDCLKADAVPPSESFARDFTTALRVYSVCRQHDIKALRDLAKNEIKWLGGKLTIPRMIDAVEEGYPTVPPEDEWFPEYLRSQMEAFHDDLTTTGAAEALEEIGQPTTVSKMLLSSIVENFVYCQQTNIKGAPPAQQRTTREWADEVNLASEMSAPQAGARIEKKAAAADHVSPGFVSSFTATATPASGSEDNDATLTAAVLDLQLSDLAPPRAANGALHSEVTNGDAAGGTSKKSAKRKSRAKRKKAAKLRNEEKSGADLNDAEHDG